MLYIKNKGVPEGTPVVVRKNSTLVISRYSYGRVSQMDNLERPSYLPRQGQVCAFPQYSCVGLTLRLGVF